MAKRRHRRLRSADAFECRAQILGDFFRLHHGRTPLRKRGFLAALRREAAELVDRMAQPLGLALGARDCGAMLGDGGFVRAAFVP